MALPAQTHPGRKIAPHLLPYTRFLTVDGALVTAFDQDAYERDLRDTFLLPTSELKELWYRYRELVAEYDTRAGCEQNSEIAQHKVDLYATELERRKRIAESGHPLAPPHDGRRRNDIGPRIQAVKAAWPIERMARDLMGVHLEKTSQPHKLKAKCPLPGHDDRTPSFYLDLYKQTFHCFGCGEGGDVLDLIGYHLGLTRPIEQIEALERWAAIGHTA